VETLRLLEIRRRHADVMEAVDDEHFRPEYLTKKPDGRPFARAAVGELCVVLS
jgi:hypothetical protein